MRRMASFLAKLRAKGIIALIAFFVAAVILSLWCVPNHISDLKWLRTRAAIRSSILAHVPIGSGYRTVHLYFAHAYNVQTALETSPAIDFKGRPLGGRGFIRANLGGYTFILRMDVQAIAVFDENGRLKDVLVEKYGDSL
jgi:hypothetical protein